MPVLPRELTMLKLNGRPMRPGDFEKALTRAAVKSVQNHLRSRIEAVRLPATGEFPTVILDGTSLTDISARIEGSPDLLKLVKERLSSEDLAMLKFPEPSKDAIRVFLSYGGED